MSMSSGQADRNLLFGILALQVNFLSRDALIQAMNAWVLDKQRSLGAILVEQGALRPDLHDALEVMVAKHVELHDHDPHKSLAAVSSSGALRHDLEQVADPDVQASVSHLGADPWQTQSTTDQRPSRTLRYR